MTSEKRIKVALYAARVTLLCDGEAFSAAYNKVSEQRRKKADALKSMSDKNLSLGAYLLLKYALGENGFSPEELVFTYGENGKPRLSDCPLQFNLSHSGEVVLCAVSSAPVGCDIEKIRPRFGDGIAERFFAENEKEYIKEQPDADKKTSAFYRIWTLKESYVKAVGKGVSALPFSSFSVIADKNTTVEKKPFSLAEFDCIDGYACSVCALCADAEFSFREIDITKII